MPRGQERAEALAGRAGEVEADGVVGQARRAVAARRSRPQSIVPTVRLTLRIGSSISTGSPLLQRRRGQLDQLVVERLLEPVVLRSARSARPTVGGTSGLVQDRATGRGPRAFQCSTARRASSRSTRPTISSTVRKPELGHDLAHLLGDEEEEVDDVLGLARRTSCAAPGPAWRCRPGRCSGGRRAS